RRTTHTVTARNIFGFTQRSVTVDVLPLTPATASETPANAKQRQPIGKKVVPKITLVSDQSKIRAGGAAILRWAVTGSPQSVTIDQGIAKVEAEETLKVTPSSKTTYILTAVAANGASFTARVTIDVLQAPSAEVSKDVSSQPLTANPH